MKRLVPAMMILVLSAAAWSVPITAGDTEDELLALLESAVGPLGEPEAAAGEPNAVSSNTAPNAVSVDAEPIVTTAEKPIVESAQTEAAAQQPRPVQAEEESAFSRARALRQEFMLDKMAPLQTLTPEEEDRNLEALIRQVRSLQMPLPQVTAKAEPVAAEAVEPEPEAAVQATVAVGEPNDALETVLASLDADTVVDPLALADVLFRKGYYRQAYTFYEQASALPQDVPEAQWTLFQMANCCGRFDAKKAVALYTKLIASAPNSKWTSAAQTRRTILEWSMDETIRKYMDAGNAAGH